MPISPNTMPMAPAASFSLAESRSFPVALIWISAHFIRTVRRSGRVSSTGAMPQHDAAQHYCKSSGGTSPWPGAADRLLSRLHRTQHGVEPREAVFHTRPAFCIIGRAIQRLAPHLPGFHQPPLPHQRNAEEIPRRQIGRFQVGRLLECVERRPASKRHRRVRPARFPCASHASKSCGFSRVTPASICAASA